MKKPHPTDTAVGRKIRMQRWLKGMTQQQLAEQVGVKFQQLQKYETAANRVSASRLSDIAKALDVPVSTFFDEGRSSEFSFSREEVILVQNYRLAPRVLQEAFFNLLQAVIHR